MDVSLAIWLVMATLLCWIVGLYNRLMRMRARGLEALTVVEVQMTQYGELVNAHLLATGYRNTVGSPLSDGLFVALGWVELLDLLQSLDAVLKEVRTKPLAQHPIARLAQVLSDLDRHWCQLIESPPDLAGCPLPDSMRLPWQAVTARVELARETLNQILGHYNEAIAQFPANLVAPVMGCKRIPLL